MYPFFRLAKDMLLARRAPALELFETHVSHHICWPWDLDLWMELNNGRTLTIFDLGRIPLAQRSGLIQLLRDKTWGLTVAGSVVRYRRRIRMFDKVEMHSRVIAWDKRFVYIDQAMLKSNGEYANHAIFRTAVTDKNGIVTTDRIMEGLGFYAEAPAMPEWVAQWIKAEDMRPWPPMQDLTA